MKMTQAEFEEYEEEFNNAVDKGALFDRYYDPNAAFVHPYKGTFRGKDELVRFWNAGKNSGHDGIHEILHLKNFISDDGKMAVELDIEWRGFKDTDYLGPRKKGDVFWGKGAAFYTFSGDRISHVQFYLRSCRGVGGNWRSSISSRTNVLRHAARSMHWAIGFSVRVGQPSTLRMVI